MSKVVRKGKFQLPIVVIIIVLFTTFPVFGDTANKLSAKNNDLQEEKQIKRTAAPALLVPFLIAAGAGAAVEGVGYAVECIVFGRDWDWYDFAGHVTTGALYGMARFAVIIFPNPALIAVFGVADVAGVSGAIGDVMGDFFRNCVSDITSAWDALFGNIKGDIEANQAGFETRFLPTLEDLCNETGYVPDAPCFDPIWADFRENVIQSSGMSIETMGMEYNSSYGASWRMLYPGTSRLQCFFDLSQVPRGAVLSLTHLTSGDPGVPGGGYAPVDIYINAYSFKDNYDVAENHGGSHSYEVDQWEVSDYLVPGQNVIRIEFEDDPWAYTHYWIQTIVLSAGRLVNNDVIPPEVTGKHYSNSRATNIYVTFSEAMNISTFTNTTVTVSGSSSGNHLCTFSFDHSTYELMINPNSNFSYGETVTVTLGTGVQDIAGNGLASPYTFSFSIESAPGPDPTSLNLSATLTPSSNVPPYSIVNVNGVVTYNTGYNVPVGAVTINTGENLYTASINDGSFNRNIHAPSSSRNISITAQDDRYGLWKTINRWIDIQGDGGTPEYDLTTDMIYDYTDHGTSVEWSAKDAFRTTDDYVNLFAYFDNLNIDHDLDLKWRFFYPNGNQYGSDLIWNDAIKWWWDWGWATWGFLINGYDMAYHPGRYKAQFYVDGERKATHYYVVAWDFTEHRLCKDVQNSSPYMPIEETDVFYQTDTKVMTWANFDLVAQEGELKCLFYEPSGALYTEVNSSDWPDYKLPDPGEPHSWYEWYRVWAWIRINGYSAADKCGDWRAEFYVKNPTSGNWEKYYDEYFKILENPVQNPNVSVDMDPTSPIETQSITLNVSASDNTYLKKVILYWNDGSMHNYIWDNIYSDSLSQSKDISSFLAGQEIEYWAIAWDATDNQLESEHHIVTVGIETVSVPNRPSGEAYRKVTQNGIYNTGGSSTNLGHPVEYQFDWGDGHQSSWGSESQSYSWLNEGIYFVKARARCKTHTNRVSEWSNAFMVTIDSSSPVVEITTNDGNDFPTNQSSITLEGTTYDHNPASGIDSVAISNGGSNNGTLSNWSFTVDLNEGPNTFIVIAIDNAGNSGSDSITIEYDSIPPSRPVLISPVGGEYLDIVSIIFEWTKITELPDRKDRWSYKWGLMTPESQNIGEEDVLKASEIRYVIQVDTSISFTTPIIIDTVAINIDTLNIMEEGNYYWRVRAYDLAGNQGNFTNPDSFGVDITSPSVPVLIAPDNELITNDSSLVFVWNTSTDNLSGVACYVLQYAFDSFFLQGLVETTLVETTFTVALIDTIYFWRVKAVDLAGNQSNFSSPWQFEIDTQAPQVPTLISPSDGVWLNNILVAFEWSTVTKVCEEAEEPTRLYSIETEFRKPRMSTNKYKNILQGFKIKYSPFIVKGSPIRYVLQVDITDSFVSPVVIDTVQMTTDSISLGEAKYYWRVKAFDEAGNESAFSDPSWFVIDTTSPSIDSTTIWKDTAAFWGPFEIKTKITDNTSFSNPILFYRTSSDTIWKTDTMSSFGASWFIDSIPELPHDSLIVEYYLTVEDSATNKSRAPVSGSYSFLVRPEVGIEEIVVAPKQFMFFPPTPNPSLRSIIIKYGLPEKATVTLRLYDISGRLVNTIYSGIQEKGYYTIDLKCRELANGIYFIRFEADEFKTTRKLTILR